MEWVVRIEVCDLTPVEDMTYYNYVMWEVKNNGRDAIYSNITHIQEVYDDVCDQPDYNLGFLDDNGKFVIVYSGYGEPFPEKPISMGGIFTEIVLT
jgi:hypothetical protein